MAYLGPYQIYAIDGNGRFARVADANLLAASVGAGLANAKDAAVRDANAHADTQVSAARTRMGLIEDKNRLQDQDIAADRLRLDSAEGRLTVAETNDSALFGRVGQFEANAQGGGLGLMEDPQYPGIYFMAEDPPDGPAGPIQPDPIHAGLYAF